MKRWGVVLLLCLVAPLVSCHAAGDGAAATVRVDGDGAWYRADRQLTESDFGKTVSIRVGSLVDVMLAENLTTGYMWHCNWTPSSGLLLLRNTAVGPAEMIPGAGGKRHYLFHFARPGTYKLQPQYGRWWQGGERNPVQTITLTVTK